MNVSYRDGHEELHDAEDMERLKQLFKEKVAERLEQVKAVEIHQPHTFVGMARRCGECGRFEADPLHHQPPRPRPVTGPQEGEHGREVDM
jgi:hypothetical protein